MQTYNKLWHFITNVRNGHGVGILSGEAEPKAKRGKCSDTVEPSATRGRCNMSPVDVVGAGASVVQCAPGGALVVPFVVGSTSTVAQFHVPFVEQEFVRVAHVLDILVQASDDDLVHLASVVETLEVEGVAVVFAARFFRTLSFRQRRQLIESSDGACLAPLWLVC